MNLFVNHSCLLSSASSDLCALWSNVICRAVPFREAKHEQCQVRNDKPQCAALWHLAKCGRNEDRRGLVCHMCPLTLTGVALAVPVETWKVFRRHNRSCEELNFSEWTSLNGRQDGDNRQRQRPCLLPCPPLTCLLPASSADSWTAFPLSQQIRLSFPRLGQPQSDCQCECPLVL